MSETKLPDDISDSQRKWLSAFHGLADGLFNQYRFFGSRKLYRKFSKTFLPKLKVKTFIPTIFGFDLVVGPENAFNYYYLGFYESGALNIFKNILAENDVFVDVGANIGLMSFFASQLVGRNGIVLAVEPTEIFFQDLSNGIKKNNFENIIPLKIGLGSSKKQLPIYHNKICPSLIQTDENDPSEIIEIRTLDSVVEENNISKIKLIKIDVEGFELEVIKGGQRLFSGPNAPLVCVEYVKDQQMIKENGMNSLDLLKKFNNYKFFQLEYSSDIIGKLIEVKNFEQIHRNDNVFCLLENHIVNYKKLIK